MIQDYNEVLITIRCRAIRLSLCSLCLFMPGSDRTMFLSHIMVVMSDLVTDVSCLENWTHYKYDAAQSSFTMQFKLEVIVG